MKKGHKKNISLPNVKEKDSSYVAKSIDIAKRGCYGSNKQLRIDEAYGDYNMHLFRNKNRKKFVREIPSAFTNNIKLLLTATIDNPQQQNLANQHNDTVQQILKKPKQIYFQEVKKAKELEQKKKQQEAKQNEFIKGFDQEVREYNGHLSFEYLNPYQSTNWFKVKDYSSQYVPPRLPEPKKDLLVTTRPKKKRKGHIFFSDAIKNRVFRK